MCQQGSSDRLGQDWLAHERRSARVRFRSTVSCTSWNVGPNTKRTVCLPGGPTKVVLSCLLLIITQNDNLECGIVGLGDLYQCWPPSNDAAVVIRPRRPRTSASLG